MLEIVKALYGNVQPEPQPDFRCARVKHIGTLPGHLPEIFCSQRLHATRLGANPRIRGIDSGDIGDDLDLWNPQRCGEGESELRGLSGFRVPETAQ